MIPRAEPRNWRWHGAAFAIYALLGLIFIDHGKSLSSEIAGATSDPYLIIWFLAWWPWAIGHHASLLFTPLVWQPLGVYLGWVTAVPLLALAGWPLTLASPILTYNVFTLLAPVASAFIAYLLCLLVARSVRQDDAVAQAAAIIGGFLFGYSSYEMVQNSCHLNLSVSLFVPALLALVLCRLQDKVGRPGFILLGSAILLGQFAVSVEIFGMSCIFGGIAWLLAIVYLPQKRPALRRLVLDALLALPVVAIPLSPVLVSMARHADQIHLPAAWPYCYTTDLLNFIIPTSRTLFAYGKPHFVGAGEQGGYLGLPLLLLIALFIRKQRDRPASRMLIAMFLLLAVFSLGPRLWVAGHYTNFPLPWTVFVHLPLLKSALPARFALFVSLCAAMIAALWVASAKDGQALPRLALAGLACLSLLPALQPWTPSPAAAFFRPGRVQAVLGADARVLVLPFSIQGPASFWQAENRFGFSQTGGYVGFPPQPMQHYPAVPQLFGGVALPGFTADFVRFCTATHTQFVVIGPGTPPQLKADIARLGWPEQHSDDVVIYAVPAKLGVAGLDHAAG